jgi:hypothetical protein
MAAPWLSFTRQLDKIKRAISPFEVAKRNTCMVPTNLPIVTTTLPRDFIRRAFPGIGDKEAEELVKLGQL